MRTIRAIDIIAFIYTLYFSITLAIFDDLFSEDLRMYKYLTRISDNEWIWYLLSLSISFVYFVSFLERNSIWLSVIATSAGGLFFIVVGTTYMYTYPNFGAGLFILVGIACFFNIPTLLIRKERIKEDMIKHEHRK